MCTYICRYRVFGGTYKRWILRIPRWSGSANSPESYIAYTRSVGWYFFFSCHFSYGVVCKHKRFDDKDECLTLREYVIVFIYKEVFIDFNEAKFISRQLFIHKLIHVRYKITAIKVKNDAGLKKYQSCRNDSIKRPHLCRSRIYPLHTYLQIPGSLCEFFTPTLLKKKKKKNRPPNNYFPHPFRNKTTYVQPASLFFCERDHYVLNGAGYVWGAVEGWNSWTRIENSLWWNLYRGFWKYERTS